MEVLDLESMTNEELVMLYQNGNDQCADILWYKNVKLVHKTINKYNKLNILNFEDKLSACGIAFSKTLKNFNVNKGIKFSTYLTTAMERMIVREVFRGDTLKPIFKTLDKTCTIENDERKDYDNTIINKFHNSKDEYFKDDFDQDLKKAFDYALSKINEDYKSAVLKFIQGKASQTDIAKEMNVTPQAINDKMRIFRKYMMEMMNKLNSEYVWYIKK